MSEPESPSTRGGSRESVEHPRNFGARAAAVAVASAIIDQGFIAYFAGGCVRDEILGLAPTDFDIATDATPDEIAKIFRGARGVGESFGVMLVRWKDRVVEVATFRADGVYHDGRRPSDIRFTTAEEDAQRRDFTINGLFRHPTTGEIVDFVKGQEDLAKRVLRAIGDPVARLREDRLRTLRAVRFVARFELTVDPETEHAICDAARDLVGVSRERIGGEFRRMFSHRTRARAVQLIEKRGLDAPALGESNSTGPCERVERIPDEASFGTVLAAWWLDRRGRADSVKPGEWRSTLNTSGSEWKQCGEILDIIATLEGSWEGLSTAQKKRLAARMDFNSALSVLFGIDARRVHEIRLEVDGLALEPGGLAPMPFLTGVDLIALGHAPGPKFKAILEQIYDRQLEGHVTSNEQAVVEARTLWTP